MKNTQLLVLGIVVVLFAIGSTAFFFGTFTLYDVVEYPVDVVVADFPGFGLGLPLMHFGQVTPGGASELSINVSNSHDFPLVMQVVTKGKTADWLRYPQDVVLQPRSVQKISFSIEPPSGTPYGNYSGSVKIKLLR